LFSVKKPFQKTNFLALANGRFEEVPANQNSTKRNTKLAHLKHLGLLNIETQTDPELNGQLIQTTSFA
jgi:hypothetical protein